MDEVVVPDCPRFFGFLITVTSRRSRLEWNKAVKIYTKTGDEGTTGLLGKGRVPKDDIRIEAYGTIDELNAVLGLIHAQEVDSSTLARISELQNELFVVGSALADPDPKGPFHSAIQPEHVQRLERLIDELESELPPLSNFILPGGAPAAAKLHLARTVCRRAERQVVGLARQPGATVPSVLIVYLNRLSDLLFVMARLANHRAQVPDIPWKGI